MGGALPHIREYLPEDEASLGDLVMALQELERVFDPDPPSGENGRGRDLQKNTG